MDKKVLSVSVAAYNVSEYLDITIHSLVSESKILDDIEIIIVNDGSSDDTSQIAMNLKEKYPYSVVVINKKNGGYGSTINSSIKVAKGKYYKLLDGDDQFFTGNLLHFVEYLSVSESDIVISPYNEVKKDYTLIDNHREVPEQISNISDKNYSNLLFTMHEITIKTDVLRNYGIEIAEHCFYTDTEYVFYCFASSKTICRFSKPIYCYRIGIEGQSVSLSGTRKHHRDFLVVAERLCKAYENMSPEKREEKKEIYEYILMKYMYNTFRAFMLLENPLEEKVILSTFDTKIRENYNTAYNASMGSKLVKLLRTLHFKGYSVISKLTMNKHRKEFI